MGFFFAPRDNIAGGAYTDPLNLRTWEKAISKQTGSKKEPTVDQSQVTRADAARQLAIDAARMAANTRCHNVVVLDVTHLSPVTDFFVIATGTSPRQMRSAAEDIEEMAEPRGYKALTRSGFEGEAWILVDFVDVVLHIFNQESRLYYDLENLWGDAKKIEWETPAGKSAATP